MAIRIEHIAPGIYVDQMTKPKRQSASTTGSTAGRTGNRYRDVMGAEQPEGIWIDPVADAVGAARAGGDRQNAVQMIAARKRNERRARLGMGPIDPSANAYFIPKEQIDAEREAKAKEAEWNRKIGREDDLWKRGKQDDAEAAAVAQFQKDYDGLFKQIDALMSEPAEAWRNPDRRAALVELYNKLLTGEKNKDWNPLEKYPAAIADMMKFLNGHDPATHLIPKDQRPGAQQEMDGAKVISTGDPKTPYRFGGWGGNGLPPRKTDDRGQDWIASWNPGGWVEWNPVEQKAQKPAGEVWNEWATKWKSARDNYHVIHGTQPGNKEQDAKARAHADAMFPKPPEGGAQPEAAQPGSSSTSQPAGPPRVVVGDDNKPVVPRTPSQPHPVGTKPDVMGPDGQAVRTPQEPSGGTGISISNEERIDEPRVPTAGVSGSIDSDFGKFHSTQPSQTQNPVLDFPPETLRPQPLYPEAAVPQEPIRGATGADIARSISGDGGTPSGGMESAPQHGIPIDANGDKPVKTLQGNPPTYVMRDGTKRRAGDGGPHLVPLGVPAGGAKQRPLGAAPLSQLPPGSKWIDNSTIQLPDGRIIRKHEEQ